MKDFSRQKRAGQRNYTCKKVDWLCQGLFLLASEAGVYQEDYIPSGDKVIPD